MKDETTYVYTLRAARPEMLVSGFTEDELRAIAAHSAYLEKLSREGVVLFYGRTLTTSIDTFGIVLFTAGSETGARAIMDNDPGVKAGVHIAVLYPFRVFFPPLMSDA